jgi:hypothetical protein
MDPQRHANPRIFDPTRYQDDFQTAQEAAMNPDPSKRDHMVFGAGRRRCQGMHIAERSLFLAIARLLWAFNFERVVEGGKEVVPDPTALSQGFLVQPLPFPVKLVPRSQKHAEVLRKEWQTCEELLDGDMQWKSMPEGMSPTYGVGADEVFPAS